jgi:hypothetical protein
VTVDACISQIRERQKENEMLTGLLSVGPTRATSRLENTVAMPLTQLLYDALCTGNDGVQKLQARFR